MNNTQFIEAIAPHAQRAGAEYNVLPSLIIAQGIHESAWGRSGLATKGLNLFGVKGTYGGQSVTMKTWEHLNGKDVMVDAAFRKYPSWYESIIDLLELYKNGLKRESRNRYAAVLGETDYKRAAHAVADAGYATDPAYAAKVINTIEAHNLTRFDSPVQVSKPVADKKTVAKPAGTGSTYTVKRGDNLSTIAKQYGVTVDALVKANSIKNKNLIQVGQLLSIPKKAPTKAKSKTYKVKRGDNLSTIAKRHGTTVSALVKTNKIADPDKIYVGQVLKI